MEVLLPARLQQLVIFCHTIANKLLILLFEMSRVQLAVRIPESLQEKLEGYLLETGVSKTEVVVSAIAQYLGCVDTVPLSQRMAEIERRLAELEAKDKTEAK